MRTLLWAVLLLELWPELGGAAEPPGPEDEPPAPVSPALHWRYLTRLEATGLALLPREGLGAEGGFAQMEPTLIPDGGADLGLNLGAPVRLRLGRGGEGAGLVRPPASGCYQPTGPVWRTTCPPPESSGPMAR